LEGLHPVPSGNHGVAGVGEDTHQESPDGLVVVGHEDPVAHLVAVRPIDSPVLGPRPPWLISPGPVPEPESGRLHWSSPHQSPRFAPARVMAASANRGFRRRGNPPRYSKPGASLR